MRRRGEPRPVFDGPDALNQRCPHSSRERIGFLDLPARVVGGGWGDLRAV